MKSNPSDSFTSWVVPASELDLYFNLMFAPIVEVSTPIVTLSPVAFVVIPFSPTILNLIPPFLSSCWVAVVVALSPPNWIVFVANLWNWEPFIASVDVELIVPGATFLTTLSPALIPSLVIDIGAVPGVAGFTVNPSPFITVLSPAAVLNSADVKSFNCLFRLYVYLWSPAVTSCATVKLSPAT